MQSNAPPGVAWLAPRKRPQSEPINLNTEADGGWGPPDESTALED